MAGVGDKQVVPVGPWPDGIDNLHRETELPTDRHGNRLALREAVNVDVSDSGHVSTRSGTTKVQACTNGNSLFADTLFPYALYVDGATLYATSFGGTPITVQSGMAPRDVAYRLINDRVYWSNGQQTGIVLSNATPAPWGIETPDGVPTLAAAASGGLDAGTYQVAVSFRSSLGEDSGALLAGTVTVTDGQGITLSGIPQPVSSSVLSIRVWMSPPNGDVLYFYRDLAVGMTSTTLLAAGLGIPLQTQFLDPMPAGDFVDVLGGRAYTASGNVLSWSETLRFGLSRRTTNRMTVGQAITMMAAVGDGTDGAGMYVADHKRTYWLGGPDPFKFSLKVVYPQPAIVGSQVRVPGSMFALETSEPVVYWLAANGVACLGLPGGLVTPLRENQVVAPAAEKAASVYRDQNGLRQVITALRSGSPQGMAFSDSAAATVITNGITT